MYKRSLFGACVHTLLLQKNQKSSHHCVSLFLPTPFYCSQYRRPNQADHKCRPRTREGTTANIKNITTPDASISGESVVRWRQKIYFTYCKGQNIHPHRLYAKSVYVFNANTYTDHVGHTMSNKTPTGRRHRISHIKKLTHEYSICPRFSNIICLFFCGNKLEVFLSREKKEKCIT